MWAAAFALLLALRVVASTGLMPAFDHGQVTIIACPDADDSTPLAIGDGHHHHHGNTAHQHPACPYAAASWLSLVGNDYAPLWLAAIIAFALLAPIAMAAPVAKRRHLRPPLRGPPLPA
jgi:hypothetical protein